MAELVGKSTAVGTCVEDNIGDDTRYNRIKNEDSGTGLGREDASAEVNSRQNVERSQEQGDHGLATGRRYRVGYWMTEKKERRLNFFPFCDLCRKLGIDIIKLRFDITLEEQGPFDLILHKITDQVALTVDGTVKTSPNIEILKKYLAEHPHIEVVDPIDRVMLLLDRHRQYRYVVEEDLRLGIDQEDKPYFIPSFAEFTSKDVEENKRKMREQNVQFPFVCKPSLSHCQAQAVDPAELNGPGYVTCPGRNFILCHSPTAGREEVKFSPSADLGVAQPSARPPNLRMAPATAVAAVQSLQRFTGVTTKYEGMAIVFNEDGLKDLEPPCVAQTFINHNARLFKVFIIGNRTYMLTRPSIKNFYPSDQKTIFFNSNDVSKSYSSSFLNKLDADDTESLPLADPDPRILDEIVADLQKKLNLEFLGIDVIIENGTGRYAVIDINAFPGYDGVTELFPAMVDLLCRRLSITHIDIPRVLAEYGHPYCPPDPSGIRTHIVSSDDGVPATLSMATVSTSPVSIATASTATAVADRTFDKNKPCDDTLLVGGVIGVVGGATCVGEKPSSVGGANCMQEGLQDNKTSLERMSGEKTINDRDTVTAMSFSEGTGIEEEETRNNDEAKNLSIRRIRDQKAIIEINRNNENCSECYNCSDESDNRINGVAAATLNVRRMNGLNSSNDVDDGDSNDGNFFVNQSSPGGAALQSENSPSSGLSPPAAKRFIASDNSGTSGSSSHGNSTPSSGGLSDGNPNDSLRIGHHSNSVSDGHHSNSLRDGSNNLDKCSHGNGSHSNGSRETSVASLGSRSPSTGGGESLIVLAGFGMH